MFWDNLMAECERQGIKVTPLIQEVGCSSGNLSSWKRGGAVHSDTLLALSKRLGVSTDYLLTGQRISSSDAVCCANRDEEMLIMMFRSLSEYQRGKAYSYVQGLYDSVRPSERQSWKSEEASTDKAENHDA
jgi:transcriptional regulator with XRE-family HTH domain